MVAGKEICMWRRAEHEISLLVETNSRRVCNCALVACQCPDLRTGAGPAECTEPATAGAERPTAGAVEALGICATGTDGAAKQPSALSIPDGSEADAG